MYLGCCETIVHFLDGIRNMIVFAEILNFGGDKMRRRIVTKGIPIN